MKKYIYIILSLFFFTQWGMAKDDCEYRIKAYFNKNYVYAGGVKAADELARQRRCLNARNPIYSDAHEYEQKHKYLLSIDDNFKVRKDLIDYQETAEILAERASKTQDEKERKKYIYKSSEYTDKFNDILIKHYDKILAAKILKDQVESGFISKEHQKELFTKLDKYLFKIGKCNPGICEGWGLISGVSRLFPKCQEDSCQKNITYETLYFDLVKETENDPKATETENDPKATETENNLKTTETKIRATETIKKLLAKDFGTPKSNGEVKAPLMMALYHIDYEAFSEESKRFLNRAKKRVKYNYQDAILLPIITQLMISAGEAQNLLPYTDTKYINVAGLETNLALLSAHIGDTVRQKFRANLEIYYEYTTACSGYRYEEYDGEKFLKAGTPAAITQDTELDLFLRRRIQSAYWIDDNGNLMPSKATNYWCSPTLRPEEIDSVFASVQIAKRFIKEAIIDDIVLLPFFAFNKIKTAIEGMRQTSKALKISYYNDKALEVAQNTRRVEMQIDRSLRSLNEIPEEVPLQMAAGQDFTYGYIGDWVREGSLHPSYVMGDKVGEEALHPSYVMGDKVGEEALHSGYMGDKIGTGIGDTEVPNFVASKNRHGGSPKKTYKSKIDYGKDSYSKYDDIDEEDVLPRKSKKSSEKSKKNSGNGKSIDKEEKRFNRKAPAHMRRIGYKRIKELADELGITWEDLQRMISDKDGLCKLLEKADKTRTEQIIKRMKNLYGKYKTQITGNSGHKFTFTYIARYNSSGVDISNIYLVEEVVEKNEYLKTFFEYGTKEKPSFLSDRWFFSPKSTEETVDAYTKLLGCTYQKPCYALFKDNNTTLYLYSYDNTKMIRVTPHEYTISEQSSGLHFHYYEIAGDHSINHRFLLDYQDPFNNLTNWNYLKDPLNELSQTSAQYLQDLLLPSPEILTKTGLVVK